MQDASWSWERATTSITSINQDQEILVFGYAAKLFRDDEKALDIDQGRHLVPWMGQTDCLIDRFDVRGLVNARDMPSFINNSPLQDSKASALEKQLDLERFADLKEDESDHEEEANGGYSQVPFDYGNQDLTKTDTSTSNNDFKVPPNLSPPVGLNLPSSMKDHQIIEKTAIFRCQKGPQIEVLLKVKQANNALFNFLNMDSPLNQYYRFLVSVIKSGKYKPNVEEKSNESKSSQSSDESDDDGYYLHPSLFKSKPKTASSSELPNFTSSESSSYSKLVENLKDSIPHPLPSPPCEAVKSDGSPKESEAPSSSSQGKSLLPVPPSEIAVVIDKLAERVAKNGDSFESTVKKRQDARFSFLIPGNIYHAHYISRKLHFIEEERKLAASQIAKKTVPTASSTSPNKAISFSISISKTRNETDERVKERNTTTTISTTVASTPTIASTTDPVNKLEPTGDEDVDDLDLLLEMTENEVTNSKNKQPTDTALADKLASAARGMLAKEKKLQQERKQKATLFLSLLKTKERQSDKETGESNSSKAPSIPFIADDRRLKSDRRDSHKSTRRHRSRERSRTRSRSRSPVRRRRRSRSRSRSRSRGRERGKDREKERSKHKDYHRRHHR